MLDKMPVDGKYIMYKGRPLVREKNRICYGDMTKKCYLSMLILTNKVVGDQEVPDNILVQILTTGENTKILKQGTKAGLFDAFDIGTIWLDRLLTEE